ncbi:MAG: signal peptidase II [Candidatus Omnitrophota bacterium]|nr:signal peptidase II [Candidatus Omnitrophota bacterium]
MIYPAALAASVVFFLDRITKIAAAGNMSSGESISILPKIFHLTLVLNNGTAFGLMKGQNSALAAFTLLAVIAIIFYIVTRKGLNPVVSSALGLTLGGALGNLFDRIRFGYIIDFLDFRIWPVFNVADSAITIGMVMLAWHLLTKREFFR